MYNDELKKSYLGTIANDNSYKACLRVFRAVEDMEIRYDKDICEMNVDEILTVLDLKTGTRSTSIIQFMSLLRSYVDWCIQNGKIVGENNFDKIDFKEIDHTNAIRGKYLKSVEEFEEICAVVYKRDAFYNETTDMAKELMIRLLFAGMENKEIVLLEKTGVDMENRILQSPVYPEIEYHVSQKVIDLCKYCINQEEVMYSAPSKGSDDRMERMANNKYVIRPRISALRGKSEDTPMNEANISRKAKDFFTDYYEATEIYKELTPNRIRESAIMIQIHNSENPDQFINTAIKTDIMLRNPGITSYRLNEKLKRIKETYAVWLAAFYN